MRSSRWIGSFLSVAALVLVGFGHANPSVEFDPRVLLKDFEQAQKSQLKALQSREKTEAANLKRDQNSRQKAFDAHEKAARKQFFASEHPGSEKRAYMKDLLARRSAFRQQLNAERLQQKHDGEERIQALQALQRKNHDEFTEALKSGKRPPDVLWPQPSEQASP